MAKKKTQEVEITPSIESPMEDTVEIEIEFDPQSIDAASNPKNNVFDTRMYNYILIDNGHGQETAGKRSPDGKLLEWEFNRSIKLRVMSMLGEQNTDMSKIIDLVPEDDDIPLGKNSSGFDCRVKRANVYAKKNALLISIHANAAGNGQDWHNAKGFAVFYDKRSIGSKITANVFADVMTQEFTSTEISEYDLLPRNNGVVETEGKFSIIYYPYCDALLLELGFMDNKEDCAYLMSDEGRDEIAKGITNAILKVLL